MMEVAPYRLLPNDLGLPISGNQRSASSETTTPIYIWILEDPEKGTNADVAGEKFR